MLLLTYYARNYAGIIATNLLLLVLSLHEESNKCEACVEISCEAIDSLRWAMQPILAPPVSLWTAGWLGSGLDLEYLRVGEVDPPYQSRVTQQKPIKESFFLYYADHPVRALQAYEEWTASFSYLFYHALKTRTIY